MRALILGASGFIGHTLLGQGRVRAGHVAGTYHNHPVERLEPLDVTDPAAVGAILQAERPDVVFMPACLPNVEYCETASAATRPVNVEAVRTVAEACDSHESRLVFFSSDYVFDGQAGPYVETDTPSPINVYGRQKLESEQIVRDALPGRHLILRVTVVFGYEPQGKNFVVRLLSNLRQGKPTRVPSDQLGSPTLVDDLVDAAWRLVERGADGLFHVAGADVMSRVEFAHRVARAAHFPEELIRPVATAELGQQAARPLSAGMICGKAEAAIGRRMLTVEEALDRLMRHPAFRS